MTEVQRTTRLLHTASLDGVLVIADQEKDRIHEQQGSAATCWKLIPRAPSWLPVGELIEKACEQFEGDPETIGKEIEAWIQNCEKEELVTTRTGTPTEPS